MTTAESTTSNPSIACPISPHRRAPSTTPARRSFTTTDHTIADLASRAQWYGKRRKAIKVKGELKESQKPLPTVFNCLFCNHERSVIIKLDKKGGVGSLHCNVCGQQYQTSINYLSGAVDVYADWVDAADEVKKEQRRAAKGYAAGASSSGAGASDPAARDMMERRREENFIDDDDDDDSETGRSVSSQPPPKKKTKLSGDATTKPGLEATITPEILDPDNVTLKSILETQAGGSSAPRPVVSPYSDGSSELSLLGGDVDAPGDDVTFEIERSPMFPKLPPELHDTHPNVLGDPIDDLKQLDDSADPSRPLE
ncbi:hypothetical protein Dda_0881 [Drechslerella dactyloides]|uniref:Transcription elongation factor 1 homolog n=1 Tax=Drechslerella dactyloides TaxID=74499 RepID=A0AAD6NMG1_DREDA|nr:hypothetical protein Dda_0881 [Drechslerella dactyloides]